MIPKECKRLAEVDFPIAAVSAHAAREKSIRHGHPSTLHLWWARRPLAACRSMLLALLLPDPGDPHCPADFKKKARELLRHVPAARDSESTDDSLRRSLLRFIADFANWDNAGNALYLNAARGLVKAAHPEEDPLVVDPFAGGGSIPLEALRLGCEAFASDLNPVACLINKVLLEDIPRHGPELAEQLREAGEKVKTAAAAELARFYPPDADGGKPIAYLWARTVRCEKPDCGAEIPLVKSFWLSKKDSRKRALRWKKVDVKGGPPRVEFEVFTPAGEKDVHGATVTNAKATCLCCGGVLPGDRTRAQLAAQRGGADVIFDAKGKRTGGARLLALVRLKEGVTGRDFRVATERDYDPVLLAQELVKELVAEKREDGLSSLPDEPINSQRPSPNARGMSAVTRYGVTTFGEMFTRRQVLALDRYSRLIASIGDGPVQRLNVFALSKLADLSCSLCRWEPVAECPRQLFSRHAAAYTWDFAEGVPLSSSSGGFAVCVENVVRGLESLAPFNTPGSSVQADAAATSLPKGSAAVWFTDPPYYDAIPYADLSDFFYVWLKRCLGLHFNFGNPFEPTSTLSPKLRECVWNQAYQVEGRPKDGAFFERAIEAIFGEARRYLSEDGVGGVVFAHQTTEGWEALLGGLIRAGWIITASWPITTEMASRIRARNTSALATSVHLVCRPRPADAPVGDWSKVQRELVGRIDAWMKRLQAEGVRGADLVFACIGPALEVYSKHPRVLDAEDRSIPLGGDPEATDPHERGFLAYVWELVGRAALAQVLKEASGSAAGLEEDARLTALFLWTLQATTTKAAPAATDEDGADEEPEADDEQDEDAPKNGKKKAKGFSLPFDVARRFAQPLGIHLDAWEDRVIATSKGVVRLLPVAERADQLFGKGGIEASAEASQRAKPAAAKNTPSLPGTMSEPEPTPPPVKKGKGRKKSAGTEPTPAAPRERTTLDRVHSAMLLQNAGQTAKLKALLAEEMARGPEFLRLANALYPLYPDGCDEKRLLQALLLAAPKK